MSGYILPRLASPAAAGWSQSRVVTCGFFASASLILFLIIFIYALSFDSVAFFLCGTPNMIVINFFRFYIVI